MVPEILKLDYDLLYFKVESITQEFAEVVVNEFTQQTSFVSRRAGSLIYWPDFLLNMHSVEFFPESNEKVRARSFFTSSEIATKYEFMRPLKMKGEWLKVILLDGEFKNVGSGWIQWKRDNKLLVMYNLLS